MFRVPGNIRFLSWKFNFVASSLLYACIQHPMSSWSSPHIFPTSRIIFLWLCECLMELSWASLKTLCSRCENFQAVNLFCIKGCRDIIIQNVLASLALWIIIIMERACLVLSGASRPFKALDTLMFWNGKLKY